jgi:hypothetical protein
MAAMEATYAQQRVERAADAGAQARARAVAARRRARVRRGARLRALHAARALHVLRSERRQPRAFALRTPARAAADGRPTACAARAPGCTPPAARQVLDVFEDDAFRHVACVLPLCFVLAVIAIIGVRCALRAAPPPPCGALRARALVRARSRRGALRGPRVWRNECARKTLSALPF